MAFSLFTLGCRAYLVLLSVLRSLPILLQTNVDLGANVDRSAEQLYQFAILGSHTANFPDINNPSLRLLNVGSEAGKGNNLFNTAKMLEANPRLNYQGFVEDGN